MNSFFPYLYPKPVMPKYFDRLKLVYSKTEDGSEAESNTKMEEQEFSQATMDLVESFNSMIESYPKNSGQPLLYSLRFVKPDKKLNLLVELWRTEEREIYSQFFFTSHINETVTIVGANLDCLFFTQFHVYTCFPKTINEISLEKYEAAVELVNNEVFEITVRGSVLKQMITEILERKNLFEIVERPANKNVYNLFTSDEMQDLAKTRVD